MKLSKKLAYGIFTGIGVLWLLVPLTWLKLYPKPAELEALANAFASVNALFAGLAFAGVILAVLLQSHQLEQQRRELVLQRDELRLQREQLTLQREEMSLQREEMKRSSDAQEKTEEALRKRLEFEQNLQNKRLTLALYDEWTSPEMQAARNESEKYLTPGFITHVTLSKLAKDTPEVYRLFSRVLRYLEKVTLLARYGEIDAPILAKLIGSDIAWAYQNVVVHFAAEKEDRKDLSRLVKTVRESELAKWAG